MGTSGQPDADLADDARGSAAPGGEPPGPRVFVLVHGAWHDPWVWNETRATLAGLGHESIAVDLPSTGTDAAALGGLDDDVAALEAAVAAAGRPVTVVAHSYGGIVATQASLPDDASIVFVAAYVPEPGQSLITSHSSHGPGHADVRREEGVLEFRRENARDVFYHDLSADAASVAADRIVLQGLRAVATPVDRAGWQSHRSSYIVCAQDHSLPVDVQRMFAARTQEVRELDSSHSPMLSRPAELARMLGDLT